MAFESVDSFVEDIARSGVFHPAQLAELRGTLRSYFSEPRALAWYLLDRGWLTTYQINQLVQGNALELLLGDYVLLERLGQGGIGQVFKARCLSAETTVALKVVRSELLADAEAIRQFEWEMQVIAKLSHPNIVKTLDANQSGGRFYFAIEYVEGAPLSKLVKQAGPLPVLHACAYTRQAAFGLDHAHAMNLIHRDIKPANLFLTLPPTQSDQIASGGWNAVPFVEQAQLKILDWGLASLRRPLEPAEGGGQQSSGEPLGTADYVAPEQAIDSRSADIRSDIYSLGCTLYYLLSGGPPFPGGSVMHKLLKHQQVEPVPLAAYRRDLPPELNVVVRKMMAKRPDDRYASPAELAEALVPLCEAGGGKSSAAVAVSLSSLVTIVPPSSQPSDRRAAVRHMCKLDSACRPVVAEIDISWPATVIDISRTGVGLRVERRFEPGTLLEIELQSTIPQFQRTLLVRVMNVRKQPEGWVVGSAFANQLTDEELWVFRAERVRPPSADCRAWYRFPAPPDTQAAISIPPQPSWPADVVNISAGGVALLVTRQVEAGTRLRLELQGSPELAPLLKLAYVVHATAQQDGNWILGCAFAGELSDDELQPLV